MAQPRAAATRKRKTRDYALREERVRTAINLLRHYPGVRLEVIPAATTYAAFVRENAANIARRPAPTIDAITLDERNMANYVDTFRERAPNQKAWDATDASLCSEVAQALVDSLRGNYTPWDEIIASVRTSIQQWQRARDRWTPAQEADTVYILYVSGYSTQRSVFWFAAAFFQALAFPNGDGLGECRIDFVAGDFTRVEVFSLLARAGFTHVHLVLVDDIAYSGLQLSSDVGTVLRPFHLQRVDTAACIRDLSVSIIVGAATKRASSEGLAHLAQRVSHTPHCNVYILAPDARRRYTTFCDVLGLRPEDTRDALQHERINPSDPSEYRAVFFQPDWTAWDMVVCEHKCADAVSLPANFIVHPLVPSLVGQARVERWPIQMGMVTRGYNEVLPELGTKAFYSRLRWTWQGRTLDANASVSTMSEQTTGGDGPCSIMRPLVDAFHAELPTCAVHLEVVAPWQCAQCSGAFYCSLDCQREHWDMGGHAQLCKRA